MNTVRNILLTQLATALGLAAIVWLWLGSGAGDPHLVGWTDRRRAERISGGAGDVAAGREQRQALLQAGWLGEIGKLAIAALLFAVVFVNLKPLHPGFPVHRVHRDPPGAASGSAVR
jgi:hypothetical protein